MPPPPPSKSYLLKFDDLSDSDDDDEDYSRACRAGFGENRNMVQMDNRLRTPSTNVPTVVVSDDDIDLNTSTGTDVADDEIGGVETFAVPSDNFNPYGSTNTSVPVVDDELNNLAAGVSEDDEDDDIDDEDEMGVGENSMTAGVTKKKRKKKGKKKKKKKKESKINDKATTSCINASSSVVKHLPVKKHLSFGNVFVTEFTRCLGMDVVPCDGGWPLGMSNEPVSVCDDSYTSNTDHIERIRKQSKTNGSRKQFSSPCQKHIVTLDLSVNEFEEERARRLAQRFKALQEDTNEDFSNLKQPLETRQWDYKRKSKNPLFRALSEKERMNILIAHSTHNATGNALNTDDSPSNNRRNRSGSLLEKSTSSLQSSSSSGQPRRTRSKSFSSNPDKLTSSMEIYNETYNQMDVHAVRNELERIRNNRSDEGSMGCTCRKLLVYLIPADGSGGKKASNRRMKIQQVKIELRKRHLLPSDANNKTREELELLLHTAVENEPCCSSEDCPCVLNGIECQADTCSCWHSSHQTPDHQKKYKQLNTSENYYMPPPSEIKARCGNRNGMYVVDSTAIDEFRNQYIYCQTIPKATTKLHN